MEEYLKNIAKQSLPPSESAASQFEEATGLESEEPGGLQDSHQVNGSSNVAENAEKDEAIKDPANKDAAAKDPAAKDPAGQSLARTHLLEQGIHLTDDISTRMVRSRTQTERGAAYSLDQAIVKMTNAVKTYRRHVTLTNNRIEEGNFGVDDLNCLRDSISRSIKQVQDCYLHLSELPVSEDRTETFDNMLDDCLDSNAEVMFRITMLIGTFKNAEHSRKVKGDSSHRESERSSRSKHTHRSKSSKHSSKSSHSSASSSIKAEAVAKAAALKAKLKYCEMEHEHQAKLDKIRLLRDIEVEEAKADAVTQMEGKVVQTGPPSKTLSGHDDQNIGLSGVVDQPNPYVAKTPIANNVNAVKSNESVVHVSHSSVPMSSSNVHCLGFFEPQETVCKQRSVDQTEAPQPSVNNACVKVSDPLSNDCGFGSQRVSAQCLDHNAPVFIPRPSNTEQPPPCNVSSQGFDDVLRNFSTLISNSRLPVPEPGVFCGEPLEFPAWRKAFTTLIENKNIAAEEKVYYLKRYVGGVAKESVEGFLLIPTEDSYYAAMSLIDKRFGNSFVVAQAFKAKIEQWPKISSKDIHGLQRFSDFLCQCEVAARANQSLRVLDDDTQNRIMLQKLPDWIVTRWARKVHDASERYQCYPSFKEFVKFLTAESEIACNPITAIHGSNLANSSSHKRVQFSNHDGTVRTLNTFQPSDQCVCCNKNNHVLNDCFQFKKKTLEERKSFVMEKRLCFGCLRSGHGSKSCQARSKCSICNKSHPTSLHGYTKDKPGPSCNSPTGKECTSASNKVELSGSTGGASVSKGVSLLASGGTCKSTMVVPVYLSRISSPGQEILTYALLDTQSDTSFVSEQVCDKLGTAGIDTHLRLTTMTSESQMRPCRRIEGLQVRGFDSNLCISLPPLYTHNKIPADEDCIPTPSMVDDWPYLQPVVGQLMPKSKCGVGLLIGFNCPRALAPRQVIPPEGHGPFAQRTDLGWGIIGLMRQKIENMVTGSQLDFTDAQIILRTKAKEVINPQDILKFFDKEEGYSSGSKFSQDDAKFLSLLNAGITQTEDGHYQMPLPLKDIDQVPVDNKVVAVERLKGLVRKFRRDKVYYQHYVTFMKDLQSKGYAEMVPEAELGPETPAFYLPHHGVYNAAKPGKVRVVMDGSARFHGKSLNDYLLTGPDLMNGLIGVLCRFRQEEVAFMCDIEGMFQQFRVNAEHRNFLRFLWFKDDDCENEPIVLRSTVHLFGAASSPAVANYGLKRAASDKQDQYGPQVVEFFHRNFYVDDGLMSVSCVSEAANLIHRSRMLCNDSGLHLHKFVCNSREVIETIPTEDRASTLKDLDLSRDPLPIERALGVRWCVESDTFKFRICVDQQRSTRRGVLSTVCSMFDPLGFISPVVLQGKLILQDLCRDKLGWDDILPDHIQVRWERWLTSLPRIEDMQVPRCFKPADFGKVMTCEIHFFSDASTTGYGQCSYLRLVNETGKVHCSFVIAKSRVAPLKTVTIPRLELAAAVLSTEVSQLVVKELDYNFTPFYWTDNKAVLGFINNDSRRFHVYVANRVQAIRSSSNVNDWRYVSTAENPADIVSRGATAEQLQNSSWFTGPSFLWERHIAVEPIACTVEDDNPEVKRSVCFNSVATVEIGELYPLKDSNWPYVKRVVAICLRFIQNLKSKTRGFIQVSDVVQAEYLLMRQAQCAVFQEDIQQLSAGHAVKGTSRIKNLDPFLDDYGLIRVGGRIKQATVPVEIKHPLILPKCHRVTDLIVRHCHAHAEHQGRGITTNCVRNHGFWIIGMSSIVAKIVHDCITCRKIRRAPEGQKMGDLPADRLEPGPVFTHVGVDYFGPFFIKEGRKEVKRYGVLFTCLNSRGVHMETACRMDTDSFINALRRFLSIRGPIRTLRSDRGTNLVGAYKQLQEALQEINEVKVREFLLQNNCDFLVNVPQASHQGGVWERQIRSIRSVLSSLLGSECHQLDDESFRTFMSEAANVVNSRPLTVSCLNDPMSLQPLSPNHLLTMKSDVVLPPPGVFQQADVYSRRRWRRVQHFVNSFWDRWRKELLAQWQERQRWCKSLRNMSVGDLVLVMDDCVPRCQWKMARIVEVFPGKDGLVRKVKLVLGDPGLSRAGKRLKSPTMLERPIHKLILLLETQN